MLLPKGTVFAIVDGEKFKLYRNEGTEADPSLKAMKVPSVEETNHSAGVRHHDRGDAMSLEQLDEFAHAAGVASALNAMALDHAFDKLVIVADPKSLGEMRKHYHKELSATLICELDRTMTNASVDDIVKAVRAA